MRASAPRSPKAAIAASRFAKMSSINRDVAALLAASRAAGSKPFEAMTPEEARHAYLARREIVQCPPDAVAEIRNVTIRGINGGDLALRFYRGTGTDADATLPCLLYLHGWVLGNLLSHGGVCCRLANEAGCWTVAVDYRLAPEHPFPAALDVARPRLPGSLPMPRRSGLIGNASRSAVIARAAISLRCSP